MSKQNTTNIIELKVIVDVSERKQETSKKGNPYLKDICRAPAP